MLKYENIFYLVSSIPELLVGLNLNFGDLLVSYHLKLTLQIPLLALRNTSLVQLLGSLITPHCCYKPHG